METIIQRSARHVFCENFAPRQQHVDPPTVSTFGQFDAAAEREAKTTVYVVGQRGERLHATATIYDNRIGGWSNTPADAIADFVKIRQREIVRLKAQLELAERHVAEAQKLTAADFSVEHSGF